MNFPQVETLKDRASLILTGKKAMFDLWKAKGHLTMEEWIVAGAGAARYLKAISNDQVVTQAEYEEGVKICLECDSMVREVGPGDKAPSNWCGPPLVDRLNEEEPTCGCLVLLKRACATKDGLCPQKKNPLTINGKPIDEFRREVGDV